MVLLQILNGTAFFAVGQMLLTPGRFQACDISAITYNLGTNLITKKPTRTMSYTTLVSPFDRDLWTFIMIVIFVLMSLSTALSAYSSQSITDAYLAIIGAFLQQGNNNL
jgi:hypothetical protein